VGLIYYYKKFLFERAFFETYGDWIQIDRVSERSVFTTWVKLGYSKVLNSTFSIDPYFEGFTRQSDDIGYGPLENEIRVGARINTRLDKFYIGALTHYSLSSNINPGQYDALLVLSGSFY
jgi:hypothetical protein